MSRAPRWGQGPHPDYKFGSIQRIDPKTGEAKLLYKEVNGHVLSAPNDLVFDTAGGFYFTDLGKRYARHRDHGGLYYALPDGSKIVELAYPILSPEWLRTVARRQDDLCRRHRRRATLGVRYRGAWRDQGEAAHPRTVDELSPAWAAPRGSTVSRCMANGNICVATLTTGYITEISPAGDIVRAVKMPDTYPTNICFGGADMRTAYITLSDSGRLGSMQWPEPGLKLNFN